MKDNLRIVAKDLRFNIVTEKDISEQVDRIYEIGYNAGKADQRKVNNRMRFRYNVLISWLTSQMGQFSMYTKRHEYKQIIDGICDIADSYMFENNLNSGYSPKVHTCTIELDGSDEEFIVDAKKELSYLLVDVVENFIAMEQEKLERSKERAEEELKTKTQLNAE